MSEFIFLQNVDIENIQLVDEHKKWLHDWLKSLEQMIESGNIASSLCLQAVLTEIAVYGKIQTDWEGVLNHYLKEPDGTPLAYSESYGKQLFNYNQWKQTPIHSIYTHWWIENYIKPSTAISKYVALIESFIQGNGWIYNPAVSETGTRTRMKCELMMSLAMGIDILHKANSLQKYATNFEALLSSFPLTIFMSAEYFRAVALNLLAKTNLMPSSLADVIQFCEAGQGYADFSTAMKIDDYMGTAKRTSRDKVVHSPLSGVHANYLASFCEQSVRDKVSARLAGFGAHLKANLLDIPSFKMRDIDVPFGAGVTPLEIICTSYHITKGNSDE